MIGSTHIDPSNSFAAIVEIAIRWPSQEDDKGRSEVQAATPSRIVREVCSVVGSYLKPARRSTAKESGVRTIIRKV